MAALALGASGTEMKDLTKHSNVMLDGEVKKLYDEDNPEIVVTLVSGILYVKQIILGTPYYECDLEVPEDTGWGGEKWYYAGETGDDDVYVSSVITPDLTQDIYSFNWLIDGLDAFKNERFTPGMSISGGGRITYWTRYDPATTNILYQIATTNDLTTLGAGIVTNAAGILYIEKLAQYGDGDIVITPDSAFTFDGAGTITAYTGTYVNVVVPYEIGGVAVTALGDNVFATNANIVTIIGGKNLTTIGGVFADRCGSLTTITLQSLTTIGDDFAYNCDALATIALPSATTIGGLFAYRCAALTTISLPSATTIGDYFANICDALTRVEFSSDVPTIGINPYNLSTNVTNYVLSASAEGWTNFFGGSPVVFPSHTLETLAVSGTATGIEAVTTDGFVIKSQMDAADTLPYSITAVDGTATVSRVNGWLQSIDMTGNLVLDVGAASSSYLSQINLSINAGTHTLGYSVNATNIVTGLSDITATNVTTILFYSPMFTNTIEAVEL